VRVAGFSLLQPRHRRVRRLHAGDLDRADPRRATRPRPATG
jgi:hypothetical protein